MAKPKIQIQFPHPADPGLMSRVMNFAEDVYRATKDAGIAEMDEIDHYCEGQFVVSVFSKRNLGQVNKIINRYLDTEKIADLAIVTRLDLPGE